MILPTRTASSPSHVGDRGIRRGGDVATPDEEHDQRVGPHVAKSEAVGQRGNFGIVIQEGFHLRRRCCRNCYIARPTSTPDRANLTVIYIAIEIAENRKHLLIIVSLVSNQPLYEPNFSIR